MQKFLNISQPRILSFQKTKTSARTPPKKKAHFSSYITLTTPKPIATIPTNKVIIRTSQPVHQREWEPISHIDRPQEWSVPSQQAVQHQNTMMHQHQSPEMSSLMHQKQHQPGSNNAVVPQEIHYKSQYIIISPGQPALFPVTPGPIIKDGNLGGGKMFLTTPPPILEAAHYPPTTPYPSNPPSTTTFQPASNLPKRKTADAPQITNNQVQSFFLPSTIIFNLLDLMPSAQTTVSS